MTKTELNACLRDDNNDATSIPATQPLRILKRHLTTASGVTTNSTSTSSSSASPYAIPRRHSSYAIRRPPQDPKMSQHPLPPLPQNKQDYPLSFKAHNTEANPPSKPCGPALAPAGSDNNNMEEGMSEKGRSPAISAGQRIPSKGGIFTRVAKVLDFNRQRQASRGSGDFDNHPARSQTETSSEDGGNAQNYLSESIGREPISMNPTVYSQEYGPRTPPLNRPNLCVAKHRSQVHTRFSCPLPITSAKINISMDALKISTIEDLFTWIAVEISAKVGNLDGDTSTQSCCEVPLDIIILVDNSANMTPDLLKGACNIATHVASSMDILLDRVALGCISADPEQNLQLLLPLGTCNPDITREAVQSIYAYRLQRDEPSQARTSKALYEASNLILRYSSRGALRHIFIITANSGIVLPELTANMSSRIRFHTISPEPVFAMRTPELMNGWHLSAGFDEEENTDRHALKDSLKQVMRHLRMGLDPGVLSNLSIGLSGENGCDVEAILGEMKRDILRPGEKWTILVKVKPVSGKKNLPASHGDDAQNASGAENSLPQNDDENNVDQMIDQLHGLLSSTDRALAENILTVTLKHNHSALPGTAVVRMERKCEIACFPRKDSISCNKIGKTAQKDAPKLCDEEMGAHWGNGPIDSTPSSNNYNDTNLADSGREDDMVGELPVRSTLPPPLDARVNCSPSVALGSMNPFRHLAGGCDGKCFHGLALQNSAGGDQTAHFTDTA
ncbi:hypothetical protein AJ79_09190 [Helicocarpus griseus UAMH5409]|uniref:VWFA domain-containing protein n=1 Tax=Helicocarpus griseus UAMH5409 TaxID=1447875 RepID=A0A2B7WLR7_9EURO|nr:hypothetical protein AJ79_09190 [Helicocarpus griseus UAMH5409]